MVEWTSASAETTYVHKRQRIAFYCVYNVYLPGPLTQIAPVC